MILFESFLQLGHILVRLSSRHVINFHVALRSGQVMGEGVFFLLVLHNFCFYFICSPHHFLPLWALCRCVTAKLTQMSTLYGCAGYSHRYKVSSFFGSSSTWQPTTPQYRVHLPIFKCAIYSRVLLWVTVCSLT